MSPALSVREVSDASRKEWDGWLKNSPGGGHVLQSHEWGEFKREQGWRPVRLLLERDGEVTGAGQFQIRKTTPIPGAVMFCARGPWLDWDDEDAVRTFFRETAEIAKREGAHTVKIDPEVLGERTDVRGLLEHIGFRDARYDLNYGSTVKIDLSPSEDDLLAAMGGKTTRYNVRLSGRKGVEIRESEDFEWAFETLHGWMQALDERKEAYHITRPRRYFHDLMARMSEAGLGRFFFAFHEEEPLAGAYFLNFGDKLWYWYSGAAPQGQKLKPNYALQWEVMRWAKRHGITYYDMVSAPKKEERKDKENPGYGVYKFKMGFGGEIVDFLGCMDLPVRPRLADAWYRLEPVYHRLYGKVSDNIFY